MKIKNLRSMTLALFGIAFMLLSNNTYAVDMAVLQEQCADIGFKMRTPANGTCVLRLMKGVKAEEKAVVAQQQAYANQQAAQATLDQQAANLRQQQAEMYDLQRRSVAAQEQAAQAQAAQGVERRGGVGVAQAQMQVEQLRQQLLSQQYDYGLKLSGIGDNIALGAIKTGMEADRYVQGINNSFYQNMAYIASGMAPGGKA